MGTTQPDLYKISPLLYALCKDEKNKEHCDKLNKLYFCMYNQKRFRNNKSIGHYCERSSCLGDKWYNDRLIGEIMKKDFSSSEIVDEMERSFFNINSL